MRRILVIAACCALALPTYAQTEDDATYRNAVGVTFGWWRGAALSLKHFVTDEVALEAKLSFWNYGGEVCGLFEYYGDFGTVPGLKWYAGGGAHIGVYNQDWAKYYPARSDGLYAGPDGILGIDYKFPTAPIDLSFDVEPRVDIPGAYFNVWGGLGVRFAF